jgi:hypothetical protein
VVLIRGFLVRLKPGARDTFASTPAINQSAVASQLLFNAAAGQESGVTVA